MAKAKFNLVFHGEDVRNMKELKKILNVYNKQSKALMTQRQKLYRTNQASKKYSKPKN